MKYQGMPCSTIQYHASTGQPVVRQQPSIPQLSISYSQSTLFNTMIMYIWAIWLPVAGTYGCLRGLGFGRLEGRWKGRGHTRVPLGEGTFGARLGPACIQGHLLNQLHLLPFPSPPRQQCNKSFTISITFQTFGSDDCLEPKT